MTKRYDERNDSKRSSKGGTGGKVLTLVALLVFVFGLLGMTGLFGGKIKGFFCGVFGFVGFAFFACSVVATIGKKFFRRFLSRRATFFAPVLTVIFLVWLHVLTSYGEYASIDHPSFRSYVNLCYDVGLGTSGGVLTAWISYPLLSWLNKFAMIPLVILFFVVLFFALYPFMKGESSQAKDPNKKAAKRAPKEKKVGEPSSESNQPLRLFVDRVRPGQKDGQKIKFKGFFSKKGEEPQFFDFRDDRPLTAPEGVIPEERAERYDLFGSKREGDRGLDEYEEEYYRPKQETIERVRTYSETPVERPEPTSDLPPFIRRYRSDLQATGTAEPLFDQNGEEEQSASPKQKSSSTGSLSDLPRIEHQEPVARPGDIISNLSDLRRHREKSEQNAIPTFLGEQGAKRDIPLSESKPVPETSVPQETLTVTPQAQPTVTHPAEPEPIDDVADTSEPIVADQPLEDTKPVDATITPRESSFLTPKETPPAAPVTNPVQPAPKEEFPQESPVDPTLTRKPRSDLGGTHRSPNPPSSVSGYIPPSRVTQPNIEEVMQEQEEAPLRPYAAPPVDFLTEYPPLEDSENVEELGECLVKALRSFNIETKIVDHKTGPTFTQFAITLPDNMSVSKLFQIEMDIKRKLMVNEKDIRIIPSVPNLDAVGVEVPNKTSATIGLRSIINNPVFEQKNKLMFCIGVDVSGKPVYGNLLKMPHLLVAGATGSGKSVCLNVIITSIIYHYSPEFVRFIMIDPKKVELSGYRKMPHMLIPDTITDADKAINALSWLVDEMERRYELLMNNGCKDLESYNAKMERKGGKKLYYIVFIIDEMADLMYTARKEVDEKVNRIAAKARAAGINLILATQRPSVDVITGTIKNNMRAKIAFKVGSFVDSKTIIDRGGAESLFGYGDMLYMSADGGDPIRLQGPYISDEELEPIVEYVKEHNDCRFDYQAERNIFAAKEVPPDPNDEEPDEDGEDPFFKPALAYFIEVGQASITKLQIKYHIGYGRAARIVDTMAERGYLGPSEGGNKPRQVRITRQEFDALYGDDGGDGDGGDQA